MHQGTCTTHVPRYKYGSPTHGGEENVPGIPGACATRNFTYLARGPCSKAPATYLKSGSKPLIARFTLQYDSWIVFIATASRWHVLFQRVIVSCLGCTCYRLLGHKNSDLHLLRLNTNLPQYILGQEYEAIFVEKINSQFIERQAFYHRLVQKYITSVKMKKKQCFMQKQKLTSQHQVTWDCRKYRTSCDTCAPIYFGLLLFYGRFSRIHAVPLSGLLYLYWGGGY